MRIIKKIITLCAGILTALVVAGLVATIFSPGALAQAVEPESIMSRFSSGNNVTVIPAAAFRSDGVSPDGYFFSFSGGYLLGSATTPCLMAPVYLPPDADQITQVWATVIDNGDEDWNFFWMNLYRVHNYTGEVTQLATLQTSGASPMLQQIQTTSIQAGQVSFPDYSYYLGTCLHSANIRLYSVRIWYDDHYVSYFPLISR